MRKSIALIFCLIVLATPLLVFAQSGNPCSIQKDATGNTTTSAKDLPICINQIYVWSLGLSALLAMLMLILGGYYYMTAAGNAEQTSKGVEIIWSAVIGMALLFGAFLLLNTINPDLVTFPTDSLSCLDNPPPPSCLPPGPRQTPQ